MSKLFDKLIKNSTLDMVSGIQDSKIYNEKDMIKTNVPMINVALSGSVEGGLSPGVTVMAGESRMFKSGFSLFLAAAYLKKYPDSVMLFYDVEFGTPKSYFEGFDMPMDRIIHCPLLNIEQLKFDMSAQLDGIERGEKVIIVVDSIGNMASKKEAEDAVEGKGAQDMSRAKQLKAFFRIITPHLTIKDIPMIVVNHVYKEQNSMYPATVVSGGSGPFLAADNIWIITRRADKNTKTNKVEGYDFCINIEKSRYTKEKSKFYISITHKGGINRYSGLFDDAVEAKFIIQSGSWFSNVNSETGEVEGTKFYRKDIEDNSEYWEKMLQNKKFTNYIKEKYKLPTLNMSSD